MPTDDPIRRWLRRNAPTKSWRRRIRGDVQLQRRVSSDQSLEPLWAELDRPKSVVLAIPDAYTPGAQGRPSRSSKWRSRQRASSRTCCTRLFRRFPSITFVVAHCGAALPALSGRLALLGLEGWVPNPNKLTPNELSVALRRLYLDTAATCPSSLAAALAMTTPAQLVYGSDCGVPCTSEATMDRNLMALLNFDGLTNDEKTAVGTNALGLFPAAAARLAEPSSTNR